MNTLIFLIKTFLSTCVVFVWPWVWFRCGFAKNNTGLVYAKKNQREKETWTFLFAFPICRMFNVDSLLEACTDRCTACCLLQDIKNLCHGDMKKATGLDVSFTETTNTSSNIWMAKGTLMDFAWHNFYLVGRWQWTRGSFVRKPLHQY